LHCWKAVLYFVRKEKGLNERQWKKWSDGWQEKFLDEDGIKSMKELRETRDYDTHKGTIVVSGEVAAGLFPLVVFVDPESKAKRELVTLTRKGLEVVKALVATHAEGP
jgi:negative regulator of sigma E activity